MLRQQYVTPPVGAPQPLLVWITLTAFRAWEVFAMEPSPKSYSIQAIAQQLSGTLVGDATLVITGIEQIEIAEPGQLTFVGGKKYVPLWEKSRASAALVSEGLVVEPGLGRALIRVRNADLAMAEVLALFEPPAPVAATGIHPTATVDANPAGLAKLMNTETAAALKTMRYDIEIPPWERFESWGD